MKLPTSLQRGQIIVELLRRFAGGGVLGVNAVDDIKYEFLGEKNGMLMGRTSGTSIIVE